MEELSKLNQIFKDKDNKIEKLEKEIDLLKNENKKIQEEKENANKLREDNLQQLKNGVIRLQKIFKDKDNKIKILEKEVGLFKVFLSTVNQEINLIDNVLNKKRKSDEILNTENLKNEEFLRKKQRVNIRNYLEKEKTNKVNFQINNQTTKSATELNQGSSNSTKDTTKDTSKETTKGKSEDLIRIRRSVRTKSVPNYKILVDDIEGDDWC